MRQISAPFHPLRYIWYKKTTLKNKLASDSDIKKIIKMGRNLSADIDLVSDNIYKATGNQLNQDKSYFYRNMRKFLNEKDKNETTNL